MGLGGAAALALVLTQLAACGDRADAQGGPPRAPPVSVASAVQKSVTDSEKFSGRLEASGYVELRPRVGGTIDKVHFVDGAFVAEAAPRVARLNLDYISVRAPISGRASRANITVGNVVNEQTVLTHLARFRQARRR